MTGVRSMLDKTFCRRCASVVQSTDLYCPHCGQTTAEDCEWTASDSLDLGGHVRWSDQRWFVLLMLFFVLGPLALPMLWRSQAFTTLSKTALTALGLFTTLFALSASSLEIQELIARVHDAIPASKALIGR
jgi:hypothetical protein